MIKYGIDADPDFYYERLVFGYPAHNIVLDKASTLAIQELVRNTREKRVKLMEAQRSTTENTMTESMRKKKEIEWDNLYNEGGEGFNPYRADEVLPIIEPLDA